MMTLEEKAREYDAIIRRAGVCLALTDNEDVKNTVITVIALDDNDDKRIIESLIEYFKDARYRVLNLKGTTADEVLVWLEKQNWKKRVCPDISSTDLLSEGDETNVNNILYIMNQLKDQKPYDEDDTAEKCIEFLNSVKERICQKK